MRQCFPRRLALPVCNRPEDPEGSIIYDIFANHSLIDRELVLKLLTERGYLRRMVMVIRYSDGSFVDAVIHWLDGGTLRAAVAGIDDAVEFTLIENKWISE